MTRKENEATINCPSRGDDDDVVVSRSSFPLFVVFFFHTVVVSEITSLLRCCCSSLFFFFSSSSRARAQKRERYAHKSMHVNLERKRRDVPRVFGRRSMISFFSVLLPRCVSFEREKPTNTKEEEETEESSRSSYVYIYITRANESRCFVLCARVSLYSS